MSSTDPNQSGHTEPLDTVDFAEPAPRSGVRRGVATAAVSVLGLVVAFGLGTALARSGDDTEAIGPAASSSSASPSDDADEKGKADDGTRPGPGRERRHGPGGFGPMLGLGLSGAALHGSFVIEDPDGGYRTVVTQRGEVTAVSATSLTVKSEDGFTETYTLDEDTTDLLGGPEGVDDLSKGDEVGVSGERSGGTVKATHVMDLSRVGDMLRHKLGRGDKLPGGPDAPSPSPSTTTEGSSTGI
jgi:hypothetical protein